MPSATPCLDVEREIRSELEKAFKHLRNHEPELRSWLARLKEWNVCESGGKLCANHPNGEVTLRA